MRALSQDDRQSITNQLLLLQGKPCTSCRLRARYRSEDRLGKRKGPFGEGSLDVGAPGRAHSLGGVSPLHTRQGEVLAEQQGCPSRGGIRRKLEAKRCSDEQPADRGDAVG